MEVLLRMLLLEEEELLIGAHCPVWVEKFMLLRKVKGTYEKYA